MPAKVGGDIGGDFGGRSAKVAGNIGGDFEGPPANIAGDIGGDYGPRSTNVTRNILGIWPAKFFLQRLTLDGIFLKTGKYRTHYFDEAPENAGNMESDLESIAPEITAEMKDFTFTVGGNTGTDSKAFASIFGH